MERLTHPTLKSHHKSLQLCIVPSVAIHECECSPLRSQDSLLWWLSWPDGGGMARIQGYSLVGIYARCRLEAQSISQIAHGYPARGYTRSMTALQTSSDYCLGTITRARFSCTRCAASDESRFCMRCSNGLVGCSKPYVSAHVLHILNPGKLDSSFLHHVWIGQQYPVPRLSNRFR